MASTPSRPADVDVAYHADSIPLRPFPLRIISRSLSSPRLEASAGHVGYRQVSAATTEAMLNASLCFSPAGDMMTTRRLFDTLAAGCVPVLLKAIGNAPKQPLA